MRIFYLFVCFFLFINPLYAESHPKEQQADKVIEQLYHSLKKKPISDMSARIKYFSAEFLEKPYLLGALGEGMEGQYDQFPIYRVDAFDCETLVDTVLALAFASDLRTFKACIRNIRYKDGKVGFIERNHFLSLDWNLNNQEQGFIKDITRSITNKKGLPIAKTAKALINKPGWYEHFTQDKIKVAGISNEERTMRLAQLKKEGEELESVQAEIPYIPLTVLFDEQEQPNQHLFQQIPDASIIEIIRPNWDLRDQIGTRLNASHLGFGIWVNDTLMFRNASSIDNRVADVPLIDYLKETLKSPTIKGINIQVILPEKILSKNCMA